MRSSEDRLPGSMMSSRISAPRSMSILLGLSKFESARVSPCRNGSFRTPLRWNLGKSLVICVIMTAFKGMEECPSGSIESSALKGQSGTSV